MMRIKINDMLDYYEIETNGFRPDIQAFNPREQLKFLESLFSSLIDKKNVKMYFFIHEQTPNYIFHDSKRIMQILVNLLSNAIKYTKKGTILVLFDWKQTRLFEGLPEGVIKFTISDSG
jgi:signal transduction histidine kinase